MIFSIKHVSCRRVWAYPVTFSMQPLFRLCHQITSAYVQLYPLLMIEPTTSRFRVEANYLDNQADAIISRLGLLLRVHCQKVVTLTIKQWTTLVGRCWLTGGDSLLTC